MSMHETGRAEMMPTPSPEESTQDQAADRALGAEEGVEAAKADTGVEEMKERYNALAQLGLDALAAHEKLVAETEASMEANINKTQDKMVELLSTMMQLEGNEALPANSKAEAIEELNRQMNSMAEGWVDSMMAKYPEADEDRITGGIMETLKASSAIAERVGDTGLMRMYEAKMQDHALASQIAALEGDSDAMTAERQQLNGLLEPYAELYMKLHPEATEDQAMDAAIEESGLKNVEESVKGEQINREGFANLRGRARIGRAKLRAASQQAGRASGGGFASKV